MSAKAKPHDALQLLAADHEALLAMFRDYERRKKGATAVSKGKAALRICHRLSIHCAIKEEIFYPAVASVLGSKAEAMLTKAQVEHGAMRGLMATIEHMAAGDTAFDPTMKVLGDYARQHFKDEESELFPGVRHGDFDLAGTGERMATRQLQLETTPAGKAAIREARRVLGG